MKFFFLFLIPSAVFSAAGPVYVHEQPAQSEFRNIYERAADVSFTPKIFTGTSTPSFRPEKVGDLFVNTSSGKVYVSTGSANSGDWAILN